jgi:hypothetical protein
MPSELQLYEGDVKVAPLAHQQSWPLRALLWALWLARVAFGVTLHMLRSLATYEAPPTPRQASDRRAARLVTQERVERHSATVRAEQDTLHPGEEPF